MNIGSTGQRYLAPLPSAFRPVALIVDAVDEGLHIERNRARTRIEIGVKAQCHGTSSSG